MTSGAGMIAAGIALAVLLPEAPVHFAHREPGFALRALLGWPGTVIVGGGLGVLIGLAVTSGDDPDDDDGEGLGDAFEVLGWGVLGAGIGALAWPICLDAIDTRGRQVERARARAPRCASASCRMRAAACVACCQADSENELLCARRATSAACRSSGIQGT